MLPNVALKSGLPVAVVVTAWYDRGCDCGTLISPGLYALIIHSIYYPLIVIANRSNAKHYDCYRCRCLFSATIFSRCACSTSSGILCTAVRLRLYVRTQCRRMQATEGGAAVAGVWISESIILFCY